MSLAIAIVVGLTVVGVAAVIFDRPLTLSWRGMRDFKASIERTEATTVAVAKAIGTVNGEGNVATQLAKIDERLTALDERVDVRTHVLRAGGTEPEELAPYIQDWFHRLNTQLTITHGALGLLWREAKNHDFDLPDMQSLDDPKEPPT